MEAPPGAEGEKGERVLLGDDTRLPQSAKENEHPVHGLQRTPDRINIKKCSLSLIILSQRSKTRREL